MIYKYEIACKEAGLNEEKIVEIRKIFDNDKKRLKREKQRMLEEDIRYFSVDAFEAGEDVESFEIEDPNADTEALAMKNWELSKLREYLAELTPDDIEFIMACYQDAKDSDERIAEKMGLTRNQVRYKKKMLLKHLKERFEGEK